MAKKLTEAQQSILQLLEDKGSRHRDWIEEIVKARGFRVVNRSINTLIERGMVSVDEDDYLSLAALDAPAQAEVAPDEADTAANLRQALRDVKAGNTEPVATLWDGVYDARSDTPEAETKSIAEAGPGYTWTREELAQYSPDNPYPPYTPGASADDTIASYEYEVAALKQQLADRDATIARLVTVLDMAYDHILSGAHPQSDVLTAINEVANAADALNGTGA